MRTKVIAAVLFTALVLAGAVLAGDYVPFKGEATATYVSTDYDAWTSLYSVSGKSTHMGNITGTSTVYYTPPPDPFPYKAEVVFVAANGDEVHLTTSTAGASYTITGGTGRFAGATGSGDFSAAGYSTVALEWDGTIGYKKK